MKKIDYNPNSLSHHNENIQYWVTQGIVIDGERYSVEELFVRGNTLYGVLSTNKIDFYEYPLATNVTQNKFDPSGILNRLDRLESIPQYKYDDTGVNKPDKDNQELSISGNNLSISGGNTVEIPQPDLRVLNDFATKEYVDTLVKSSKYDPQPVLDRLQLLENRSDKDTVYDDTDLKNRVKTLEDKPNKPNQTLSINDRTISISGGNSIELPINKDTIYDDTDLKKRVSVLESKPDKDTVTKVVSTSNGVNVSSSVDSNITTYDINIDKALDNYYDKAKTYTKDEVNEIVNKQEQKATDITVYKGKFSDRNFVKEGDYDTPISPRITLTYSKSTGVGILKIDFNIVNNVFKGQVIATLPNDAPVPAELVESQVWIGNVNTSIWVNKNSRSIQISRTVDSSIFNKRIILNIPGIFKLTN